MPGQRVAHAGPLHALQHAVHNAQRARAACTIRAAPLRGLAAPREVPADAAAVPPHVLRLAADSQSPQEVAACLGPQLLVASRVPSEHVIGGRHARGRARQQQLQLAGATWGAGRGATTHGSDTGAALKACWWGVPLQSMQNDCAPRGMVTQLAGSPPGTCSDAVATPCSSTHHTAGLAADSAGASSEHPITASSRRATADGRAARGCAPSTARFRTQALASFAVVVACEGQGVAGALALCPCMLPLQGPPATRGV